MHFLVFKLLSCFIPLYVIPQRLYHTAMSHLVSKDNLNMLSYHIMQKHRLNYNSIADKMIMPSCLAVLTTKLSEELINLDERGYSFVDNVRQNCISQPGYYDVYRPKFQTRDPKLILDMLYNNRQLTRNKYNELMDKHHRIYLEVHEACEILGSPQMNMENINNGNRIQ